MAKNYFNRYVWLIDTIRRHGYITYSDISDIFGIDIRFDKTLGYYLACDDLAAEGIRDWFGIVHNEDHPVLGTGTAAARRPSGST